MNVVILIADVVIVGVVSVGVGIVVVVVVIVAAVSKQRTTKNNSPIVVKAEGNKQVLLVWPIKSGWPCIDSES